MAASGQTAQPAAKVALVTGGSSGIGRATAILLAQKGYKVAVAGSKPDKVASVANEVDAASSGMFKSLQVVLDFSDPANGKAAVEQTVAHFKQLDLLVNNAGIFTRSPGYEESSYATYKQVATINLDSSVAASLAAVGPLAATKGTIVFVSSVASIKPAAHGYAYCISKAGMSMFAKCLAIDLAKDGIRVNVVSPGPVLTPIFERVGLTDQMVEAIMNDTTLSGRIGKPEEIASAIAYLASPEADFVSGHEMFVDGGYLIKPAENRLLQPARRGQ